MGRLKETGMECSRQLNSNRRSCRNDFNKMANDQILVMAGTYEVADNEMKKTFS